MQAVAAAVVGTLQMDLVVQAVVVQVDQPQQQEQPTPVVVAVAAKELDPLTVPQAAPV